MPASEFLAWLETLPAHARSSYVFVAFQAEALAMCGEIEQARNQLGQLREDLEERGALLPLGIVLGLCVTETELFIGNPQAALDAGLRGCELLDQIGEQAMCSTASAYVAQAFYGLDRLDEADAWAERSRSIGATDDAATQGISRLVRAKVLARRGAADDARRTVEEAMAILEDTEQTQFQAIAFADLSDVLRLIDRPDEARAALLRAIEYAQHKGIRPMAERLEAMLAAE